MNKCGMKGSAYLLFLVAATLLLSLGQAGCAKKGKVPVADAGPVRVVLLPFSVPEDDQDLQWAAMAGPLLLAKAGEQFPDFVVVPLWESMPTAIASAGAARSFNDETAAAAANWLGAKWAVMGGITRYRGSAYSLTIDFVPAKSSEVPYRYIKTRRMESTGAAFSASIRQFLRYTTGRPLPATRLKIPGLDRMRPAAEALDREYGWFVEADPGSSRPIVDEMVPAEKGLARLLFNPALYPNISE